MTTSSLARTGIIVVSMLLAACGGGSTASTCTLGSAGGCGGTLTPPSSTPPPVVLPAAPDPAALASGVNLVASSSELPSSGDSEVVLTALVRNSENNALGAATVSFAADSGLLTVPHATTDAAGKATALLGTGGSALNRPIKVAVRVGKQTAETLVQVVGTSVTVTGPSNLVAGTGADFVAAIKDSAGRPIAGAELKAVSSLGNAIALPGTVTDSQGQLHFKLKASQRGTDLVSLSALGASTTKAVVVTGLDLRLSPAIGTDSSGNELLQQAQVGTCQPIDGRYDIGGVAQLGMLTLASSRGQLFSDAACTQALDGPRPLVNGNFPPTFIQHDTASIATVTATVDKAASSFTRIEFVAPLTKQSWLTLQPELNSIGTGERTTLVAMVRDGTSINNVVKGATVQFKILADPSGGNLVAPLMAVTGSDGTARAVFVGGAGDSGNNGALLEARLLALPAASATSKVTVSKKALSVQIGRGNTLVEYSNSVLQEDFAVFVTDAAGNGVPGVMVNGTVWPTAFRTGSYEWQPDTAAAAEPGMWRIAAPSATCPNEDVLRRGLYNASLDLNNNGVLDPGIPLSITSSGKTDALGMAALSLRYPRDRAGWVRVELKVNGQAYGTESTARSEFVLGGLAKDYTSRLVLPPGAVSPYGTGPCR